METEQLEPPGASISITVDGVEVYSGKAVVVPRRGDTVIQNGKAVRVNDVTWTFHDERRVNVEVEIADEPYTF